jgi:hypothetical protein
MYVNDIISSSHHVELALYADDTAVITTPRRPALLVKYLEIYISNLERWLREWRIAIKVSKSSAMLFAKAAWRIRKFRLVYLFGVPIYWVKDLRYLGVTFDSQLTWAKHIGQVRK